MNYGVQYTGDNTLRNPSGSIWATSLIQEWKQGLGGIGFFDDFENFPQIATSAANLLWNTFLDTGCTAGQGTTQFGTLVNTHDGTAADAVGLQRGGSGGAAYQIAASAPYELAFEWRGKKSEIAQHGIGLFVGLGGEGLAADNTLIDTTHALADNDFLGFHVAAGTSGATCNFVYRKNGQAMQTLLAGIHTFAADTFVKLGFRIRSRGREPGKRMALFVNGVEKTTYLTDTLIAASLFPSALPLSPLIYSKNGSGSVAGSVTTDWVQCGMADRA